eukprot:c25030_g18_i1 orf=1-921(+)
MYGKCGSPLDARSVFDKLPLRDLISWNAMIAAYGQNARGKEALDLFRQMQQEGMKPDGATFVCILGACLSPASLTAGKVIHASIVVSRFELDVVVGTALLNMYKKCGTPDDARNVFDNMRQRNVVTWTAMITAYCQNGNAKEALELFWQMQQQGVKPNNITFASVLGACASPTALTEGKVIHANILSWGLRSDTVKTALVNMYGKCGSLEDARSVFSKIYQRDVVCWTAMIAACVQNGHGEEALEFFGQMQRDGVKPNSTTFVSVVGAGACIASLTGAKVIHAKVVESGFDSDDVVQNSLVNMYGK